jgi:dihydroorotase
MKNYLIQNATIVDEQSKWNGKKVDILIENNFIKKIAENIIAPEDYQLINYTNLHVSPGFIDVRANGCEPGYEWKETLESLSKAAEKGGYTSVCLSPETNPFVSSASQIEYILQKAKNLPVKFMPVSGITKDGQGKELTEMFENFKAGTNLFFDGKKSISNSKLLVLALQYANDFGGKIFHYAFDKNFSTSLNINEGISATKSGIKGTPAISEEIIVARDIHIVRHLNIPIHFAGISSKGSIDLIRAAKKEGLAITCDVHINNLFFDDSVIQNFDSNYKVLPPLREESNRIAMLNAIADDTIDAIASDHSPQNIELKKVEFDLAEYGTITIENTFSMAITALEKFCTLSKIVNKFTIGPSGVIGDESVKIKEGEKACLTLYDPNQEIYPGNTPYSSPSSNTPFKGNIKLMGKIYQTIYS